MDKEFLFEELKKTSSDMAADFKYVSTNSNSKSKVAGNWPAGCHYISYINQI